eukprot:CCRYP_007923-RB/>CCRYP_007923-RB protein AED:0.30 eAED:0.30 QI:255/1/1/1/1/0.66/3/889/334
MVRYAKHLTEAIAIYHYLGGMAYAKSSNQLYTSTSTVDCTDPSIVTKDTCIFNANCEWNASTDGRRPFCIRRRDLLQESTSSPSSKPTGMAKVAKTRIIRTRRPTPAPSIVLPPSVAPARLAFDTNAPTLGLVTSTQAPTLPPSKSPSSHPSMHPTHEPTGEPTKIPTGLPTNPPTFFSTVSPSMHPSMPPTQAPTGEPSKHPTEIPTNLQTSLPTEPPSRRPTAPPTRKPTGQPTNNPTSLPTESRIAISFVFMGDSERLLRVLQCDCNILNSVSFASHDCTQFITSETFYSKFHIRKVTDTALINNFEASIRHPWNFHITSSFTLAISSPAK